MYARNEDLRFPTLKKGEVVCYTFDRGGGWGMTNLTGVGWTLSVLMVLV